MNITKLCVKRPIGTIMFFLAVILLGWISWSKLSINLLPDLSYPKITVLTEYPGSGPEEIERFITSVLEAPLSSIPGVKKTNSVSKEGLSIISLEFHWGTDMNFALLHTKEKTEETKKILPEDCSSPVILEWDPSSAPILTAVIKSKNKNLKELKEIAEFLIKPRLEQLQGVSRAEIRGGNEEEISVEIEPDKIKNLGISLSEISQKINSNNVFQSGGTIKKDAKRYTIKINGELATPQDIENVCIKQSGTRKIYLRDVGKAFYKDKLKQGEIRYQSKESISLLVYKEADGNTVKSTQNIEKSFKNMSKEFEDIEFTTISKEADLIISAINSLNQSLVFGGILAFIVLLLFLQNYRDPLLGGVTILLSIVSTFTLMFLLKVNLNIMSLGGLVLGVGMFVDNSIIVIEAIYRYREKENLLNNIVKGTQEVSGAIFASTLTTIAIFLPVIYLYGVSGKLFKDQALTVSFSLISSLIVAITLLPALSGLRAKIKSENYLSEEKKDDKDKKIVRFFKKTYQFINIPFRIIGYIIYQIFYLLFFLAGTIFKLIKKISDYILQPLYKYFNNVYSKFDKKYHKILIKILNNKILAVYLSGLIVLIIAVSFFFLDRELLPAPQSNKFEVTASTPPSLGFEETDEVTKSIEKKISSLKGVNAIYTQVGAVSGFSGRSEDFSVNSLHFIVQCQNKKNRDKIMEKTREELKNFYLKESSVFIEKNTLSRYLSMEGDNYKIKVFFEDIKSGKKAVEMIVKQLDGLPLKGLKSGISQGKPLFIVNYKENILNELGITKRDVANYINQAIRGEKAGTLKKMQKNYDIFVRIPNDGVFSAEKMLQLPININKNTLFLSDLIEISKAPSIKEINRDSQERYFLISASVNPRDLDKIFKETQKKLENIELPQNTRYAVAGQEEETQKAFKSLKSAIWLAIILVYMIMAAKFENLIQPLIIMFTVPMGLSGAFLFLWLSGSSLNIISGIGLLVLIGIGVNDAIVKVEYSNQLMEKGMSIREAILKASSVRLKPILMTTFTTVFGLVPMAIINQTGSELQKPLAICIIGGLIFTTFLTLIFIPTLYEIFANLFSKKKKVD